MESLNNGFLIQLCGASASGKSHLMYQLVEDYSFFKPITLEKHLCRYDIKKSYYDFYSDISASLKKSNVISESVYPFQNNQWVRYSFNNSITIFCEPILEEHIDRIDKFRNKYGKDVTFKRFGYSIAREPLIGSRNNVRSKLDNHKYILYTGAITEYEYIKSEVNKYVFDVR